MENDHNIEYGLIAFHPDTPDQIIHFSGYAELPTLSELSAFKGLMREIYPDIAHEIQCRYASKVEVEYVNWGILNKENP